MDENAVDTTEYTLTWIHGTMARVARFTDARRAQDAFDLVESGMLNSNVILVEKTIRQRTLKRGTR